MEKTEQTKIQLFACDLDGTLLNEDHLTDRASLNMIAKVFDRGRYFSAATGRSLHRHELERLGLQNIYRVCMNGAMVISPDNSVIASHPIPQDTVADILEAFPDSDIEFISAECTLSRGTMETKIEEFKRFGFREIPGSPLRMRDFVMDFVFNCTNEQILSCPIYKINTSFDNEAESRKMDAFLSEHRDTLTNAPTIAGMYEITARGISKAVGVAELAEHLGITEDETAVYGDGLNDLEMLRYFANSYAMANGCEEAKEAAHYQIGTNKDHAVVFHILNELGL